MSFYLQCSDASVGHFNSISHNSMGFFNMHREYKFLIFLLSRTHTWWSWGSWASDLQPEERSSTIKTSNWAAMPEPNRRQTLQLQGAPHQLLPEYSRSSGVTLCALDTSSCSPGLHWEECCFLGMLFSRNITSSCVSNCFTYKRICFAATYYSAWVTETLLWRVNACESIHY